MTIHRSARRPSHTSRAPRGAAVVLAALVVLVLGASTPALAKPAIPPGREADMIALVSPYRPGAAIVDGWELRSIDAEVSTIHLRLRGPDGEAAHLTLDHLDEEALIAILTEPKNALTKQYQKLFRMEGASLEFSAEALSAIATKAMKRKTGARGLRTILEQILLDTMYDLPTLHDVSKLVVDEGAVTGDSAPLILFVFGEAKDKPAKTKPRSTG